MSSKGWCTATAKHQGTLEKSPSISFSRLKTISKPRLSRLSLSPYARTNFQRFQNSSKIPPRRSLGPLETRTSTSFWIPYRKNVLIDDVKPPKFCKERKKVSLDESFDEPTWQNSSNNYLEFPSKAASHYYLNRHEDRQTLVPKPSRLRFVSVDERAPYRRPSNSNLKSERTSSQLLNNTFTNRLCKAKKISEFKKKLIRSLSRKCNDNTRSDLMIPLVDWTSERRNLVPERVPEGTPDEDFTAFLTRNKIPQDREFDPSLSPSNQECAYRTFKRRTPAYDAKDISGLFSSGSGINPRAQQENFFNPFKSRPLLRHQSDSDESASFYRSEKCPNIKYTPRHVSTNSECLSRSKEKDDDSNLDSLVSEMISMMRKRTPTRKM